MKRLILAVGIFATFLALTAFDMQSRWYRIHHVRIDGTGVDAGDSIRVAMDDYIIVSNNLSADDSVTIVLYQSNADSIIIKRYLDSGSGPVEMRFNVATDSLHITQGNAATVTNVFIRR